MLAVTRRRTPAAPERLRWRRGRRPAGAPAAWRRGPVLGTRLARAEATGTVSDPPLPDGPPPAISIADATAEEGPGAELAFAVTLDGASSLPASEEWETRDISARAGEDYVGGSGRLVFAPGETAKTLRIAVLDDAVDEHREVMLVVLSSPVGATIAKGWGGGTIENSDPMPPRVARAVRAHGSGAGARCGRGTHPRSAPPGVRVTVAGQRLGGAAPDAEARESLSAWLAGETQALEGRTRTVTPRALLAGSSFALTAGSDEPDGEQWVSLWAGGRSRASAARWSSPWRAGAGRAPTTMRRPRTASGSGSRRAGECGGVAMRTSTPDRDVARRRAEERRRSVYRKLFEEDACRRRDGRCISAGRGARASPSASCKSTESSQRPCL